PGPGAQDSEPLSQPEAAAASLPELIEVPEPDPLEVSSPALVEAPPASHAEPGQAVLDMPPARPWTLADPGRDTDASSAPGELISRVQAQNLEHSVYQRLKRDIDDRIAAVMQERFLPDIGGALD